MPQWKKHPVVDVLVGLPASGKSTYALKRAKEGAVILDHDALVTASHAGDYTLFDWELHRYYREMMRVMLKGALKMGRDVVIDQTHLTRAKRRSWVNYIHTHTTCRDVRVVVFAHADSPRKHALDRRTADPRGYTFYKWMEVCDEMWHSMERVDPFKEGFSSYTVQGRGKHNLVYGDDRLVPESFKKRMVLMEPPKATQTLSDIVQSSPMIVDRFPEMGQASTQGGRLVYHGDPLGKDNW